ncbi:MAG: hypothetical protein NZ580_01725 [Bacteroidia bacterium]|nr:hypothetical protein [Bacteroidia bacterium]MDW8235895.1 hypothetical protein [Bacteroidia bacterium]
MRGLGLFLSLLLAQKSLHFGTQISAEGKLTGIDTAFRMVRVPLPVWSEYRPKQPQEWDTLWIIVRKVDKLQGVYLMPRAKGQNPSYRARISFRETGVYFVFVTPPRQPRLLLARSKVYITTPQQPSTEAVQAQARTTIRTQTPSSTAVPSITEENVPEVSLDRLIGTEKDKDLDKSIEQESDVASETLIEDTELDMGIEEVEIEDIEEEDL